MNWFLILSIAGAIGSVLSLAQVVTAVWPKAGGGTDRAKALIFPILTVALTAVSVYFATVNQQITEARTQAQELLATWPSVSDLNFYGRDRSFQIVEGGLNFVERHSERIPVSLEQARGLADDARRACVDQSDSGAASCEAIAGGVIGMISAIAYS